MIAEVAVDAPLSKEREVFDYLIPESLGDRLVRGSRVIVPFGRRKVEGYVLRIKGESPYSPLKEIEALLGEEPPLSEEMIELAQWVAKRYFSPLYASLQAMVPSPLRAKYERWIRWNREYDEMPLIVLPEEEEILTYIREKGSLSYKSLLKKFPRADSLLPLFLERKTILEETRIRDGARGKREKLVERKVNPDVLKEALDTLPGTATKQRRILTLFLEEERFPLKEILSRAEALPENLNPLVSKGLLRITEHEVLRDPTKTVFPPDLPKALTPEQGEVYRKILAAYEKEKEPKPFLLHGITGSGKTEVYLQVIQKMRERGKDAIVLVPEISLTPLMVERFKRRFGEEVALLHSALSDGERYDEWRRIMRGDAHVVVGARSAIFAPVQDLGVIIIDEEHETTYKQEENPRYHAKEVAMERARRHKSLLILGSATPSMESYAHAKAGRITLLHLDKRVGQGVLPTVHVVDLRQEMREGHRSMFSRLLLQKMKERLERKEQMILLLNRRGYSTFVLCRSCGHTMECPHCDITLTYHQTSHSLRCHYCGHEEKMVEECPQCHSRSIRQLGVGTEKIEEELKAHFSGIRVIRMDQDTTSRKGAHERLLSSFGREEADVLLGTQMIAKGLDFPKVTLVGLILADIGLHQADFRAAERTFQLITQVAGRAGRHQLPGEVVVQSYSPEHYSIQLGAAQDYRKFFDHEIRIRKKGGYPPFYRLTLIHFEHEEIPVLVKAIQRFAEELRTYLSGDTVVLGPAPSQITRIKDRYRYHCMVKYKNEPKLMDHLKRALENLDAIIEKNGIQVHIDMDPQVYF
ncbi:primosomal protein N' [Thermicanus aegyptius]|uniref:primosomal protein N' n=1 Tax=Thermicanus aegyptius TaxID=94009 RepID=UPI0004294E8F|nr:primosomal protein N' [Thermicanus aegyptius]